MSGRTPSAGVCPQCGAPIPRSRVLVEYEKSDAHAVYAECPSCAYVAGFA
ncbi:MAG: hypothetical protein ABEH78_11245 [Haloferacaceae archaeon]